jgi:hypothetical protein
MKIVHVGPQCNWRRWTGATNGAFGGFRPPKHDVDDGQTKQAGRARIGEIPIFGREDGRLSLPRSCAAKSSTRRAEPKPLSCVLPIAVVGFALAVNPLHRLCYLSGCTVCAIGPEIRTALAKKKKKQRSNPKQQQQQPQPCRRRPPPAAPSTATPGGPRC